MKAPLPIIQKIWPRFMFFRIVVPPPPHGKIFWNQQNGLVIRNTQVKYESPIINHSEVLAKQTDRPKPICPNL